MKQSLSQVLKFLIMGSLAALVHGIVLYICVRFYYISPSWANVIAFTIAFVASFLGHSWVTFSQDTQQTSDHQIFRLLKWLTTSLLGFMINQGLFVLGLTWFGNDNYLFIWFVVTAFVTVVSFILGKFWAFKS